jgi:hypothetical protein
MNRILNSILFCAFSVFCFAEAETGYLQSFKKIKEVAVSDKYCVNSNNGCSGLILYDAVISSAPKGGQTKTIKYLILSTDNELENTSDDPVRYSAETLEASDPATGTNFKLYTYQPSDFMFAPKFGDSMMMLLIAYNPTMRKKQFGGNRVFKSIRVSKIRYEDVADVSTVCPGIDPVPATVGQMEINVTVSQKVADIVDKNSPRLNKFRSGLVFTIPYGNNEVLAY